jgi:Terminase large subunit, T4likevirus-type, N-terminal
MTTDPNLRKLAREALFEVAPDMWVEHIIGIRPDAWQRQLLRSPPGSQLIALTARQSGKTQSACWLASHIATFRPGSLSVVACPSQRQSSEAIRRCRAVLGGADVALVSNNVFSLETKDGSRILALPGSDESVRGLTVDGAVIADEASRLSPDLIAALRPMRARRPESRFIMLSTAWSRVDPFWKVWSSDDPSWIRLKATIDIDSSRYSPEFLEAERRALGDSAFRREYLGEPVACGASPFSWDLFDTASSPRAAPLSPAPELPPAAEMALTNPFRRLTGAVR